MDPSGRTDRSDPKASLQYEAREAAAGIHAAAIVVAPVAAVAEMAGRLAGAIFMAPLVAAADRSETAGFTGPLLNPVGRVAQAACRATAAATEGHARFYGLSPSESQEMIEGIGTITETIWAHPLVRWLITPKAAGVLSMFPGSGGNRGNSSTLFLEEVRGADRVSKKLFIPRMSPDAIRLAQEIVDVQALLNAGRADQRRVQELLTQIYRLPEADKCAVSGMFVEVFSRYESMTNFVKAFYAPFPSESAAAGKAFCPYIFDIEGNRIDWRPAYYFHATPAVENVRGIMQSRVIQVRHQGALPGAFVSTQPERKYGDFVFALKRRVEWIHPVEYAQTTSGPRTWAGFSGDIPILPEILEFIGVPDRIGKAAASTFARELSDLAKRNIMLVSTEQLRESAAYRSLYHGIKVPKIWPRSFFTTGTGVIPNISESEEFMDSVRTRSFIADLPVSEMLSEEEIERQFWSGLEGANTPIHPDVQKSLDDFQAFERRQMREEAYGAFGEGLNKLAQNRFLSPNLKRVATAGTHVLDACKDFNKLDQLSKAASSTATSAAMGGHVFAIGVAAFSVMTLFADDEDEAPQGNQMQDLANMIAAGFLALSEQLKVMQTDIDEIKRAVQVDLPNLITGAAKRLSMQMGHLYSAMTSIEKNLESRLEGVHSLLLDMRQSEDKRSVWQVESELGSILAEIKTTKTRYAVTPEAFSNIQELVRRLGPVLENWILVKAESAFYTGGHRQGSDDISRQLWASSTGAGWNIKTVAPTETLPNPEIVITAATLYSRLRKMAVLYKIPYDGEGTLIQSIQTKVTALYTRVVALSSGSTLSVYITDLKTHSATWQTRVQTVLREEMIKQRQEILGLWDLDAQTEEARGSFPSKDLLGRSWCNFTNCVGGPWTQYITPLLTEGHERLESDLEGITPVVAPALDVVSSRLQVPTSPLLPIAFAKTPFLSMPQVAISVPDELLSTLPLRETLLSGEALGCWRVKFSYTIARFQVDARPRDPNWDDWILCAMDTTRNSTLDFGTDGFGGNNDDLVGKTARFSVNVQTTLQFADQKKEEVVLDTMMVVDVKTIQNDIYYDNALGNWYSYSLLVLFERGLREGTRTVMSHEVKTRKNLEQMVKEKKEALYRGLIEKVKKDPVVIRETQFIARTAAELKAALSFVDAPELISALTSELFSNPASWLIEDPLKPWIVLPLTPSFALVNDLLVAKLAVPSKTSIATSIDLLEKVVARMVQVRGVKLIGTGPLQAHSASLVKKLHDVKELLPVTLMESRAAAGMIAIEAAKPRETAIQTNDLVQRLLEENADLRQRLARMEALLIQLASK